MFGVAQESPYDLRFSIFRIPVRVSIWFWVMGAVLQFNLLKIGAEFVIGWLLVLFVSILVHELGHALTARYFGYSPSILLYQFGGLAYYQAYYRAARYKSILISLAGPCAGFLLYALVRLYVIYGISSLGGLPEHYKALVGFMLGQMLYVNLYWGLINLLPIIPLDGGRIAEQILGAASPSKGLLYTAWLGAIVAGGVAMYFFSTQQSYNAVLFAMLCGTNITAIRELRGGYRY